MKFDLIFIQIITLGSAVRYSWVIPVDEKKIIFRREIVALPQNNLSCFEGIGSNEIEALKIPNLQH